MLTVALRGLYTAPLCLTHVKVTYQLVSNVSSLSEAQAVQNAVATTIIPNILNATASVPQRLQQEISDLMVLLAANIWKNTEWQQFDQDPALVEREEKMQGIIADHTTVLVTKTDLGQEYAKMVWPSGHTGLNLTTAFQ